MKTVLSMFIALGALVATEVSAQAPASVVQSGRAVHPPSIALKASCATRVQAQTPRSGASSTRARNAIW